MSKPDFKTALAAYKSFRKMPSSGDINKDLRVIQRLFRRVSNAAKEEKIELRKEHFN